MTLTTEQLREMIARASINRLTIGDCDPATIRAMAEEIIAAREREQTVKAAVLAEREACANFAQAAPGWIEASGKMVNVKQHNNRIAGAIRARTPGDRDMSKKEMGNVSLT